MSVHSHIVIGASSTIGFALCQAWLDQGIKIFGTYRTMSDKVVQLQSRGVELIQCENENIGEVIKTAYTKIGQRWSLLTYLPGSLEPIGPFAEVSFTAWQKSFDLNFTQFINVIHALYGLHEPDALVLHWAGGGVNNAPTRNNAYTIAKMAGVKMMELLDAELPDLRCVSLGPGWLEAPIHDTILAAGPERAGRNYTRTITQREAGDTTPLADVIDTVEWLEKQPKEAIGGRNFSVVHDAWGDNAATHELLGNKDLFKLRRYGNDNPILQRKKLS